MNNKKINCQEVMTHVCVSLGEDLNSKKCIRIKKHIEECDSCKKYLESLKGTINLFQKDCINLTEKTVNDLLRFLHLE